MSARSRSSLSAPDDSQLPLWSAEDMPSCEWNFRESRRARRLSVRILPGGRVEVVAPPRTSQRALTHFLHQHRDWIERRRQIARRNAPAAEAFPPQQVQLSACGRSVRLHLAGGTGGLRLQSASPDLLVIHGAATDSRLLRAALLRWLTETAARALAPLLAEIAADTPFTYKKVIVRCQRTRWGSCSSRGTISLNCCLLFQRPAVVRYLLIHELVHTAHMNHSERFWGSVAAHCPDYRTLDRELLEGWRRVPSWVLDAR